VPHISTLDLLIAISNTTLNRKRAIASHCLKILLNLNSDDKYLPILTLAHTYPYSKFCARSTSSFKKLPIFRILKELEAKSYIPSFILSMSTLRRGIASFSNHMILKFQVQAGENCRNTGT